MVMEPLSEDSSFNQLVTLMASGVHNFNGIFTLLFDRFKRNIHNATNDKLKKVKSMKSTGTRGFDSLLNTTNLPICNELPMNMLEGETAKKVDFLFSFILSFYYHVLNVFYKHLVPHMKGKIGELPFTKKDVFDLLMKEVF